MAELDVAELSAKYNLPERVVVEELEKTLSEVFSEWYGHTVDAFLPDSGKLEFLGFGHRDGEFKSFRLDVGSRYIRPIFKRLADKLAARLLTRQTLGDYEQIKNLLHKAVTGQVMRTDGSSGTLYVEINVAANRNAFLGVCGIREQPAKERGNYFSGETLAFYVLRIVPFKNGDDSRLEIALSRTTKSLVERIIEKELQSADVFGIKINCYHRLPGIECYVRTSGRIPKKIIETVSRELKENVYVENSKTENKGYFCKRRTKKNRRRFKEIRTK